MTPSTRAVIASTLLVAALSGCGGGNSSSTSTTQKQPVTEAQRETAALPRTAAAPVPKTLHCGATRPVWVNLHTKAYHEPGDPYYGRTKNGEYLCPSTAASQGYHAAGERHKGTANTK